MKIELIIMENNQIVSAIASIIRRLDRLETSSPNEPEQTFQMPKNNDCSSRFKPTPSDCLFVCDQFCEGKYYYFYIFNNSVYSIYQPSQQKFPKFDFKKFNFQIPSTIGSQLFPVDQTLQATILSVWTQWLNGK